jgi:tryptophan halogenase
VYCSRHISDDEAAATLLANLDGRPLADPRPIRFTTGMRKKAWVKNVVALGLASGFLEPLESTSIHMVQSGLQQLLDFFPDRGFSQVDIDAYNDLTRFHYERIRDFIILHYHANQRTDSDFWQACANMAIPGTLREKLDLYKSHGRIQRFNGELFTEVGWLQVLVGQNIHPDVYHPLVDVQSEEGIHDYMEGVADVIRQCVDLMPGHDRFIAEHCKAPKV